LEYIGGEFQRQRDHHGPLEEHSDEDDGGEQPLPVEDHEALDEQRAEVRQYGHADDHRGAPKVLDEGQRQPARGDHATRGQVGREVADQGEHQAQTDADRGDLGGED
jgi:hypothetical protein